MTDAQLEQQTYATKSKHTVQQVLHNPSFNGTGGGSSNQFVLDIDLPISRGEIPVRPGYRFRKVGRNLQIVSRDAAGVPRKVIAHEFGITPQRVGVILRGRRR